MGREVTLALWLSLSMIPLAVPNAEHSFHRPVFNSLLVAAPRCTIVAEKRSRNGLLNVKVKECPQVALVDTPTPSPTPVTHATCVPWSSQNAGSHSGVCGPPMPTPDVLPMTITHPCYDSKGNLVPDCRVVK